jgi:hypothetical protein
VAQLSCFLCCLLLAFDNAFAAPMTFKNVSTGGNHCCWWTAAEGEITDETPRDFDRYLNSEKYPGSPMRLSSPGGTLIGALELGAAIRRHGLDTEVGRTSNFDKAPRCLCVHRFYNKAAIENYSAKQFSAGDLDATQRIFAALVLYLLQMGVKSRGNRLPNFAPSSRYRATPPIRMITVSTTRRHLFGVTQIPALDC